MHGELIPTGGGDPIPLLKTSLLVGRRESCDILLRFPNVSSHHCQLDFENGYWRVRDLGSRNGIKVNGNRVDAVWLMPGDELSIARHAYEVKYTPLNDGPPPEDESRDFLAIPLLERAGLSNRERRPPAKASRPADEEETVTNFALSEEDMIAKMPYQPPQKPIKSEPAKKSDSDDSIALRWLEQAEDET